MYLHSYRLHRFERTYLKSLNPAKFRRWCRDIPESDRRRPRFICNATFVDRKVTVLGAEPAIEVQHSFGGRIVPDSAAEFGSEL